MAENEHESDEQEPEGNGDVEAEERTSTSSWKISLAVCVLILLAAGGIAAVTFFTEPTAERSGASKKTAMLVEVTGVERGAFKPRIVATGTVEPARDVVLRPQVSGRVTSLAPSFTPGGFVEEGEVLMRIETDDFKHALAARKSELGQALAQLALEEGQQDAAQAEYAYLNEKLAPENEALVLRKPQLEAARARVAAARTAVEQAELNLTRTSVTAPFDAHVLRRDANVGSQVSPNESVGRLVGVEVYWVGVELPLSKLRWVEIGGEGQGGAEVLIRNRQSWPKGTHRAGEIVRMIGALDENTRMAQVLAAIPDPLAREPGADDLPPLIVGEFVEASIEGKQMEGVIRLEKDYVRDEDTVWVMEDGKLEVKEVEVVLRDADYAYIASGLDEDDQVVTTNLSTVVEGSPLRVGGDEAGTPEEAASDG